MTATAKAGSDMGELRSEDPGFAYVCDNHNALERLYQQPRNVRSEMNCNPLKVAGCQQRSFYPKELQPVARGSKVLGLVFQRK